MMTSYTIWQNSESLKRGRYLWINIDSTNKSTSHILPIIEPLCILIEQILKRSERVSSTDTEAVGLQPDEWVCFR